MHRCALVAHSPQQFKTRWQAISRSILDKCSPSHRAGRTFQLPCSSWGRCILWTRLPLVSQLQHSASAGPTRYKSKLPRTVLLSDSVASQGHAFVSCSTGPYLICGTDTCGRLQAVVAARQLAAQNVLGPIHKGMPPEHPVREGPRQRTRRDALTASLECQKVHSGLQDKMMQPRHSNRSLHACTQSLLTPHQVTILSCLQDKVMGVNMWRQEDDYQHTVKGEAIAQRPGLMCACLLARLCAHTLRMSSTIKLGPIWPGCSLYHEFGACKASMAVEGASLLAEGIDLGGVSVSDGSPPGLRLPCLLQKEHGPCHRAGPDTVAFCCKAHTLQGIQCLGPTALRQAQL